MKPSLRKLFFNTFIFLVLLTTGLLSSCVSTNITSGRTGTYAGGAKKVFLKVQSSPDYEHFLSGVSREIERAFRERDIAVELYIYQPLSNQDITQEIERKIDIFRADLVLEIVQTSQSEHRVYDVPTYNGSTLINGTYHNNSSSTLRIRILDPLDGKSVWQAEIKTNAGSNLSTIREGVGADKTGKRIVEALIYDGIILPLETELNR